MFGYERFVAMTSGAEAVDAAVKMARKWGYVSKEIPGGECHVLTATACYHGTTLSTVSLASRRSHRVFPSLWSLGVEDWLMGSSVRSFRSGRRPHEPFWEAGSFRRGWGFEGGFGDRWQYDRGVYG